MKNKIFSIIAGSIAIILILGGCTRPPCSDYYCRVACSSNNEKTASDADEAYNACCRVVSQGSAGTGTAFYQSESGEVYILTNYHVCGNRDATVEFFDGGLPVKFNATHVTCAFDQKSSLDYAILKLNASDSSRVRNIVPLWNNSRSLLEDRYIIDTIGCPHALHLRLVRGVVQNYSEGSNIVFAPTPYGGQSGSGIIGTDRSGRPYIVGLLTWRTDEEGRDSYGGLAQPISRVINDIERRGVSFEKPDAASLPPDAVTLPYDINTPRPASEPDAPSLMIDGQRVWECATSRPVLEVYTTSGCAPCAALKARVPDFEKYADVRIYNGGSPTGQYPACYIRREDGTLLYPTLIVGFNDAVYNRILTTLKAYNPPAPKDTVSTERETVRQGVLPFSIPKTEDGGGAAPRSVDPAPEKRGGLLDRLTPPQEQEPRRGLLDGRLFDSLYNRIAELVTDTIRNLAAPLIIVIYLACFAAILSAKIARAILRGLLGALKKLLSFIAGIVSAKAAKVQATIAEDIAAKLDKIDAIRSENKKTK